MNALLEPNFFRHEFGRLVALLTRKLGWGNLDIIEDAVQAALMSAWNLWPTQGIPSLPGAWLYRVALHQALSAIRQKSNRTELLEKHSMDLEGEQDEIVSGYFESEIRDELLKTIFACCHESIPSESRLVFALKILCGFNISEIAHRLFTTEANVYKRLERAKQKMQAMANPLPETAKEALPHRLSSVHEVLYQLFNEGYLSTRMDLTLRKDLCDDAIRLTTLLAENDFIAQPETYALLALMQFHHSRTTTRMDALGDLVLMANQDRSQWDVTAIQTGLFWLHQSASGDVFSRYHAEAAIAAEHALAPSFLETRWDEIGRLYELLEKAAPSPLNRLNQAVAIAEGEGPEAGLAWLASLAPPPWLMQFHLWHSVLGELHRRVGNLTEARLAFEKALACNPSDCERRAIQRLMSPT